MKGKNIVIAIILAIVCVIGWGSIVTQSVSKNSNYQEYVAQADTWVEQGLYQRAILKYQEALEENASEEVYEKINTAYDLRFKEAEKETYDAYYTFLDSAINVYPGNEVLVDKYIMFCQKEENYQAMYDCLINAKAAGYNKEKAEKLLLVAQYAFSIDGSERSGIKQCFGNYYIISRNNEWGLYSTEEGVVIEMDYVAAGLCNEDGIAVYTGEDSRILDSGGMVLGIFEDYITEAGIFAEGFVPACSNGTYSYYDEFGKKAFGEYEMASMFQEGKAAVKKDGKWMLIDTEGNVVSEKYEEIMLDYVGRYLLNETIIVSKEKGKYVISNAELKKKATVSCEKMGIYTKDGIIAFEKDGKWGFVDETGEIVVEPQYSNAKSFSNGLAAVCEDGLWGFIDKKGRLVIDYQFSDTGYMQENGMCPVRTDVADEISLDDEEYLESWSFLKLQIGIVEE